MQYSTLPRCPALRVSAIGLGCEHIGPREPRQVETTIHAALDAGVNFFELFMPQPDIRDKIGNALAGRREQAVLMGHIGSCLTDDGQYVRSRDVALCETYIQDFLRRYRTDYIDIGMLHYIDTDEDFRQAFETPFLDYALRLKREGVVRCLGASSHVASTAIRMVETGLIDVLLFSLNPSYDILPEDVGIDAYFQDETFAGLTERRIDPVRQRLYDLCAQKGVAITVMKALGCGRLLSPDNGFARPLTPLQCIHYAMTRPAVASVFVGCTDPEQVGQAVRYFDAPDQEKDFSDIIARMDNVLAGKCMYCNHCLPCPQNIDIAAVTRLLDAARGGDAAVAASAAARHRAMRPNAFDCIGCAACEPNCPFGVQIADNMAEAARRFA